MTAFPAPAEILTELAVELGSTDLTADCEARDRVNGRWMSPCGREAAWLALVGCKHEHLGYTADCEDHHDRYGAEAVCRWCGEAGHDCRLVEMDAVRIDSLVGRRVAS